ncbi:hypothetical protein AT268_31560 [Bacillus cereus]|uniref:Phage ABA sandwich domain-containing protein n=1 Tax=Bacillus cereus TaxID=1396 RepID=A0A9X0MJP6_BACCE|nr:hypothetical protein [Bacillus cereus]KXY51044.1 hypothetical protein AT268_31560 [Bacillus cereus]
MKNRELHILIAEQVMGWKVETAPDGSEFFDTGIFCEGRDIDDVGILEKDNLNVFKPTKKLQDAWLVIEKMRKDYHFNFSLTTPEEGSLKTKCYFKLGDIEVSAVCETVQMAICESALLAINALTKSVLNGKEE